MKIHNTIVLFIVLFMLIVTWLLFRGNKAPKEILDHSEKLVKIPQKSESNINSGNNLDDEGMTKPQGISESDWRRFLKMHAIRKASNCNIRFYGKVIDQNGNPIPDVFIPIEIRSRETSLLKVMASEYDQILEKVNYRTDASGLFEVTERNGFSISIQNFIKEGYERPKDQKTHFMFGQLMKNPDSDELYHADSSKPFAYTMWKKGIAEPLIRLGALIRVNKTNGIHAVYFPFVLNGKPSNTPIPDWDIKITGDNRSLDDWDFLMTANGDGGFIIASDSHLNLAPIDGYKSSLSFSSTEIKFPRDGIRNLKIYYRGDGGKKFAAFILSYSGYGGGGGDFAAILDDIRINPRGSRNLEYEKSKRIK